MTIIQGTKMEVSVSSMTLTVVLVSLVTWALKIVNWVWLRPKKLERCLREQGLNGNPYRLLFGDMIDCANMRREASSKPISFDEDDIVPRILPLHNHNIKKHGKDSFMWFGPTPMINITDSEQIKDFLKKMDDFPKLPFNPFIKLLGTGLANHENEQWAKHRKIINPAFHVEKLKLMVPAMYMSCNEMIDQWEKLISSDGSCELDVWPCFQDLTGDVISRTAFGSSYEEGRTIFKLQREQAELFVRTLNMPYISGWSWFVPTKINKRMKEISNVVNSLLTGIIDKREMAMKAGEAAKDDLLGILLESNMKEIEDHSNNRNVGMSIEDVIDECKLFFFAGQETTSVLLVWTMFLLSRHPNWQDRAREEVLQVFGNQKPNSQGLCHLKVVTMILNEVLRLYPPITMLARTTQKETKLGNLTLPGGVQISSSPLFVHHDKAIWGEDADEFKPERFTEGVSKATKNQLWFVPFGWGPRICIGQNFAIMEAKIALTMMLQRFWFELSPSYVHAPFTVVTLQPQHGCRIILHKR